MLPAPSPSYEKLYPELQFRIVSTTADDAVERIENGHLDCALIVGDAPKGFHQIDLPFNETPGLLMRKNHPLAKRRLLKSTTCLRPPCYFRSVSPTISSRSCPESTPPSSTLSPPSISTTTPASSCAAGRAARSHSTGSRMPPGSSFALSTSNPTFRYA